MKFLRRLLGLDFPDPAVGQVWRTRHSGRAVRVAGVQLSDCGRHWHIDLEHESDSGFIAIPMAYCMFPAQWRRMLREDGRELMGGGGIEPTQPWPHGTSTATVSEPAWWAGALNRRATVEQWMFDAARGKRPMPTPEELRAWAIKLGTPAPGEPGHDIADENAEISHFLNAIGDAADGAIAAHRASVLRDVPLQKLQLGPDSESLLPGPEVHDQLTNQRAEIGVAEVGVRVADHHVQDGKAEFSVHDGHGTPPSVPGLHQSHQEN